MLPANHPQRLALHQEIHARPPEALQGPLRISYLAIHSGWELRDAQWQQLCALAQAYEVEGPQPDVSHFSADFGPFRLKWERHAEFARYVVIVPGIGDGPFPSSALDAMPPEWVAAIPGEVLVASHVVLVPGAIDSTDEDAIARAHFAGNPLVGARVAGGAASAYTDFHLHAGGFSRWLVVDHHMTPRQAGRTVQRLLEIDTYRMVALLAFPLARELGPVLHSAEQELAAITAALATATDADEQPLLERLTRLEADIERRQAATAYRFSAAAAYDALIQQRVADLREIRIEGLQTFQEFVERRLAPAMNTCRSAAGRQDALSLRVARVSQLLATRVDLTHERQNQALLASMDRRASLQLRLQETVEGLSVAAITYYIVGLLGYLAKGVKAAGFGVNPELVTGLAIPAVAVLLALAVRRTRRLLAQDGHP